MKTQVFDGVTYYDRWIKPMEGLNSGTVYAGRPPGNGPELMPWDASLNQDVAFCSMLQLGDPSYDTRFTRYTPKTQGSAYLRILDPAHGPTGGAPISSRICQDVKKFLVALQAIRDSLEVCVPGLGTRAGHRAAAAAGIMQRGGKREKKAAAENDQWVHPDAVGPRAQFCACSKKRHSGS